jgi:hypothetical protein
MTRRRQAKSNESTQNQKKDAPQASHIEREHAASQQ